MPAEIGTILPLRRKAENVTQAGIMIGLGPIGKLVPTARGMSFPYEKDLFPYEIVRFFHEKTE